MLQQIILNYNKRKGMRILKFFCLVHQISNSYTLCIFFSGFLSFSKSLCSTVAFLCRMFVTCYILTRYLYFNGFGAFYRTSQIKICSPSDTKRFFPEPITVRIET